MDVRFPGLGLEFTIQSTAFTLFGRPVQWYGVLIATGFLLAAVYAYRRARRDYAINVDRLTDVVLMATVAAIIGARLYYVLFDTTGQFLKDPISVLYIWEGGLAFYGALIGALVVGIPACKWRKINLWGSLDLAAIGFLIGQSIGRWGNFFNQEAFGNNTILPWGMISKNTTNYLASHQESLMAAGVTVNPEIPVHPCFLYESLWLALGFVLLHFFSKKRKYDGQVFFLYLIWNGLGRIWIEALRTDSLYLLGMKVSQLVALAWIAAGVLMLVLWRNRRNPEPETVPVAAGSSEEEKNTDTVTDEAATSATLEEEKATDETARLNESE